MFKIYPKDSFDRFGDDLIELVLSYISFEDSFQYKCVSKQWKRLVFNKQNKLIIDKYSKIKFIKHSNYENKFKLIEDILKNFPNITSICLQEVHIFNVYINDMFELIIKYCNKLSEIEFSITGLKSDLMEMFCKKFGSNLKTIRIYGSVKSYGYIQESLKLCPNLSQLSVHKLNDVFDGNRVLFKKLKSIDFEYISEDTTRIDKFIECNKNSLQSIAITVKDKRADQSVVKERDLKVLFKSLEKVSELKVFSFKSFDINMLSNTLKFINECKRLKRLSLDFKSKDIFVFTSNQLKELKNLKHLTINISSLRALSSRPRRSLIGIERCDWSRV